MSEYIQKETSLSIRQREFYYEIKDMSDNKEIKKRKRYYAGEICGNYN